MYTSLREKLNISKYSGRVLQEHVSAEVIIKNLNEFLGKGLVFVFRSNADIEEEFLNGMFTFGHIEKILSPPYEQIFLKDNGCVLRKDLYEVVPAVSISGGEKLRVYTFSANAGSEREKAEVINYDPIPAFLTICRKVKSIEQKLERIISVEPGTFFYTHEKYGE